MKGDYALGAKLEPIRIEIEVEPQTLRLSHVGVGYFVRLASGKVHEGGYTWHSPKGNYAQGPQEHIADLQRVVDALLKNAAEHEGVELPAQADLRDVPMGPIDFPGNGQQSQPPAAADDKVLDEAEQPVDHDAGRIA
jgi:hypothetical protein